MRAAASCFPSARSRRRPRFRNPLRRSASASRRAIPQLPGVVLWTRLIGASSPAPSEVAWEIASDESMKTIVRSGNARGELRMGAFGPRRARKGWSRIAGTGTASPRATRKARSAARAPRPAPASQPVAPALRLRFLPALRAGLLQRLPPHGRRRPRPDRLPRRLHLRVALGPRPRAQPRLAGALHARGLPRALRALQERPGPAGGARRLPVDRDLGRPRGRQRLRRRPPGGRHGARRSSSQRRAAAYRAYYEHMPLPARMRPKGPDMRIYTTLDWGTLARFYTLDDRQYRSLARLPAPGPARRLQHRRHRAMRATLRRPGAACSGARRSAGSTARSANRAPRWNVLAQQTPMAQFDQKPGPGPPRLDRRLGRLSRRAPAPVRFHRFEEAAQSGGARRRRALLQRQPAQGRLRRSGIADRGERVRRHLDHLAGLGAGAPQPVPARQPAHAAGRQPLSRLRARRRHAGALDRRPARDGNVQKRDAAAARSRPSSWKTASPALRRPSRCYLQRRFPSVRSTGFEQSTR